MTKPPFKQYYGDFEAHLTVPPLTSERVPEFCKICTNMGLKPVVIEVEEGIPQQPLTVSVYRSSTLGEVLDRLHLPSLWLEHYGFPVIRTKVEINPATSKEVPRNELEAKKYPATNYFEFHLKLTLNDEEWERAKIASRICGGLISRNILKHTADDRAETFITLRSYGAGKLRAEDELKRLIKILKEKAKLEVEKIVREYSIYDTNPSVDDAWAAMVHSDEEN